MAYIFITVYLGFAIVGLFTLVKQPIAYHSKSWLIPAILACAFLFFTLYVLYVEGISGLLNTLNHNLWVGQIFLDLLFVSIIGWLLIIPHARELKMHSPLWFLLVFSTGSIGFLMMFSRYLYLKHRQNS